MKKKSLFLMNIFTLLSFSAINASNPSKKHNQNLHKNSKRRTVAASVLLPNQANTIKTVTALPLTPDQPITTPASIAPAALPPQATCAPDISSSSSSQDKKTPFTGLWSTRSVVLSYATNLWYTPTFKRALTEAQSFDPQTQTWQDDSNSQDFIHKALASFEKHKAVTELKEFLILANKKSIPLTNLDKTQEWLRSLDRTNIDQRNAIDACGSTIGTIRKNTA